MTNRQLVLTTGIAAGLAACGLIHYSDPKMSWMAAAFAGMVVGFLFALMARP